MDLQTLLPALLGWASQLSGYALPSELPQLEYRNHAFFVENACGSRECNVIGWYDDQGVVYIDEQLRDSPSPFAKGLVVHELVHYLQHKSGEFDTFDCADSLQRERQAYSVQNSFMLQLGNAVSPMRPHPTSCDYRNASQDRRP